MDSPHLQPHSSDWHSGGQQQSPQVTGMLLLASKDRALSLKRCVRHRMSIIFNHFQCISAISAPETS